MAGYSRQSAADIIANAVIKAAPVNAEYNALRDTFALATGHKHDGSSTEGGYVPLIADSDALNKVVIDTSNNRIGFFSEVSSAAVEQIRIQDGAIVPVTDNDIDLGGSSTKFKNLYVNGIASIGSISLSGGTIDNTVIGESTAAAGTFTTMTATTVDINGGAIDGTAIGGTTAAAADFTTMDASGNATVGGTLGVTGNVTMGGTLAVTGTTALTGTATITSADINSGAMDNTTIGNTTAAAGTFTNLTSTGTSTHATVDINGGAIDGVTIGAASAGAGTFTDLTSTGTSTLATVDINGGAMDGTTIGASSAAAGSFTTVSTTGQATLATVDINGGAIDGAIIGASSAAAITGTTITGTSLVGAVTGNVTGDLTGDVTGDVTGDLTGNVTAGSGSSTFNNVTVNGTLDVTGTTIANVTDPSSAQDAATKNYVDTEVAALVDSAPGTLDTLNELAAALNDDPNFSTTITNSIATKLPLAGGTMSGAIAMGTSKITGLGDPTANQDAATKKYTTDTFLPLAGGTLTGAVAAGNNKITATYTPSANSDLTTKTYVDTILGSGTAAATSATAAASSATAAASSATAAASSATGAASSATSAAASFDSFDDRFLGAKSSAPSTDNDGDALAVGTLYFNTTTNSMQVFGSGGFQNAGSSVNGTSSRNTYTATAGQTTFAATYDSGFVDVYLNGVKLLAGTDFTATSGTSIVLASGAAVNDIVDIVAYGTFVLADHYDKTASDARYLQLSGGTLTGGLTGTTATFTTADNSTNLSLVSTDADANRGPVLDLYRNSASPAGDDVLGEIKFHGENDADEKIQYGLIAAKLQDASDGTEDVRLSFKTITAGTERERVTIQPTEVVFNEDSQDLDFRVESNGNANMLFVDAAEDKVFIGHNTTHQYDAYGAEIILQIEAAGTAPHAGIGMIQNSNDADSAPLIFGKSRGTSVGSTTIVQDGDLLGRIEFQGMDGGDLETGASIFGMVDGTPGSDDMPGRLVFNTTADGANSATERMRIDSSGNVGIGLSSNISSKLHVNSELSLGPDNNNRMIVGSTSGGVGSIGTLEGGTASFSTMTFTGGKVGISTSSPTGSLSVSSPTYLSNSSTLGSSITLNSENTASWSGSRELISFESVGNGADHRTGTLSLKLKKGASDSTLTEYMQINAVSNYSAFSTDASERMRLTNTGLGIGTSSPSEKLVLANSSNEIKFGLDGSSHDIFSNGKTFNIGTTDDTVVRMFQNNSETMRLSGGNVGIGSTLTDRGLLNVNHVNNGHFFADPHIALTLTSATDNASSAGITYATSDNDNYGYFLGAQRTNGGLGNFILKWHNNSSGGTREVFRVDSNSNFLVGTTDANPGDNSGGSDVGIVLDFNGKVLATANSAEVMVLNRQSSDGTIVSLRQDGSEEGSISVSGSTVSYNGFAGRHESSGIPTTTPKGTVVSTIDELDIYPSGSSKAGQTRTDHAKVEVSNSEGDACVYGVVDDFTDDGSVNVVSVGIGAVLVIGACSKGDLLESNGDGTAKVQSDDIIRSKTIGKVTISNSDTGVKLVSCVMYCG